MAKTRDQKEQTVADLAEALKSPAAVLTDYQGLTVREQQDLQGKLREQGLSFLVVKQTLLRRAAEQAGVKLSDDLSGPMALALGGEDPVGISKLISEFTKEHEALEITGGIVDGAQVDAAMVKRYASLPGREELLGRLMGSISAPVRNLASGLSGVSRNLVYALNAVKEKKA